MGFIGFLFYSIHPSSDLIISGFIEGAIGWASATTEIN
jgi:hypothetical protein